MVLVGPYGFGMYSCVVISYGLCGVVVSWCAGFVVRWFLSSTVVLRWYGGSKVVWWFLVVRWFLF